MRSILELLVKFLCRLALVFVGFSLQAAYAQTAPLKGAETSSWYMYFGDHKVTKNYGVHLEAQYRAQGFGQPLTQLLLRPGFIRYFPHGIMVSMLYAHTRDYPYEGGPLASPRRRGVQFEHRFGPEFRWTHTLANYSGKKAILQHRLRYEDRWIGQGNETEGVYQWQNTHRARYRIYSQLPLPFNTKGIMPDYFAPYNEVFLRFGSNHGSYIIDQNRTYGALGWKLAPTVNMEIGYMHQYNPRPNGFVGMHNNTFQFSIISSTPLKLFGKK